MPVVIGGRYGLGSKEFTPAMVRAIFEELRRPEPKHHFTIGINDDVSSTSLAYDSSFAIEDADTVRCIFWGLGSDGTVGANKHSIKIIGEETDRYAQGYFVYDSKKAGSVTTSHLRFGPRPIHAPYLIQQADFIACHQFSFLERLDVLREARPGGVFLLDSIYGPDEVWHHLPREVQADIVAKHLRFYVVDAHKVAGEAGMGGRINTVMQTCFFALSGVLPRDAAVAQIKRSIEKAYGKRGAAVVQRNFAAVDQALAHLHEAHVPRTASGELVAVGAPRAAASAPGAGTIGRPLPLLQRRPPVPDGAPEFVHRVLGPMIAGQGDMLPVSALPADGTYPSGTACWEKRNLAAEIPVWDPELCIQCGKCVLVCPHAVIRSKVYDAACLTGAPESFVAVDARYREFPGMKYTLQVSPEDCTGCMLCVDACPVKDKRQVSRKAINMAPQPPLRERESANWGFFLLLPEVERRDLNLGAIKNAGLLEPLFEFSGACSGCGETPYLKLATQLFGDRMLVANATGCSSIYGGNLPTTPWSANAEGRGPAWSNSLFEDNAEFGLGMRLAVDQQAAHARALLTHLADLLGEDLVRGLIDADQSSEAGIRAQRARVVALEGRLRRQVEGADSATSTNVRDLLGLADVLVRRSVWIVGGDGWAYDIGFGGLDHVLASGENVNVLVLDTEVYSNTGGQASKSTPRAAVAKFASRGKATPKKDLGLMAMAYGNVYVARVAMGANDQQTLHAFLEAEAYDGPSLIIAYSHCIAHGIDMTQGLEQQRLAVQSGYWPLYRFDPRRAAQGLNPLIVDSKTPTVPLEQYAYHETRYQVLEHGDAARAEALLRLARQDVQRRWGLYQELAALCSHDAAHPAQ
jgi:pyruvate-ferredoxin/flavodoxin oxidoreductase